MADPVALFRANWREPIQVESAFSTDVSPALETGEHRLALAGRPSRTQRFLASAMNDGDPSALKALMLQLRRERTSVPLYPDFATATGPATSGSTVIPVQTTADRRINVGFPVAVCNEPVGGSRAQWAYSIHTVTAIAADSITVTPAAPGAAAGSRVYPLLQCEAAPDTDASQTHRDYTEARLAVREAIGPTSLPSTQAPNTTPAGLATYRGLPVWDRFIGDGLTVSLSSEVETEAVGLDTVVYLGDWENHELAFNAKFLSRADAFKLIRLFDSRLGRAYPFWCPSPTNDFAGLEVVDVRTLRAGAKCKLQPADLDGRMTVAVRTASAWTLLRIKTAAIVSGRLVLTTADDEPNIPFVTADIAMVGLGLLVRSATDSAVETWTTDEACSITASLTELRTYADGTEYGTLSQGSTSPYIPDTASEAGTTPWTPDDGCPSSGVDAPMIGDPTAAMTQDGYLPVLNAVPLTLPLTFDITFRDWEVDSLRGVTPSSGAKTAMLAKHTLTYAGTATGSNANVSRHFHHVRSNGSTLSFPSPAIAVTRHIWSKSVAYKPDVPAYAITNRDVANRYIMVSGNHVSEFPVSSTVTVAGNSNPVSNAQYTVAAVTTISGGTVTRVQVTAAITGMTVSGTLSGVYTGADRHLEIRRVVEWANPANADGAHGALMSDYVFAPDEVAYTDGTAVSGVAFYKNDPIVGTSGGAKRFHPQLMAVTHTPVFLYAGKNSRVTKPHHDPYCYPAGVSDPYGDWASASAAILADNSMFTLDASSYATASLGGACPSSQVYPWLICENYANASTGRGYTIMRPKRCGYIKGDLGFMLDFAGGSSAAIECCLPDQAIIDCCDGPDGIGTADVWSSRIPSPDDPLQACCISAAGSSMTVTLGQKCVQHTTTYDGGGSVTGPTCPDADLGAMFETWTFALSGFNWGLPSSLNDRWAEFYALITDGTWAGDAARNKSYSDDFKLATVMNTTGTWSFALVAGSKPKAYVAIAGSAAAKLISTEATYQDVDLWMTIHDSMATNVSVGFILRRVDGNNYVYGLFETSGSVRTFKVYGIFGGAAAIVLASYTGDAARLTTGGHLQCSLRQSAVTITNTTTGGQVKSFSLNVKELCPAYWATEGQVGIIGNSGAKVRNFRCADQPREDLGEILTPTIRLSADAAKGWSALVPLGCFPQTRNQTECVRVACTGCADCTAATSCTKVENETYPSGDYDGSPVSSNAGENSEQGQFGFVTSGGSTTGINGPTTNPCPRIQDFPAISARLVTPYGTGCYTATPNHSTWPHTAGCQPDQKCLGFDIWYYFKPIP